MEKNIRLIETMQKSYRSTFHLGQEKGRAHKDRLLDEELLTADG